MVEYGAATRRRRDTRRRDLARARPEAVLIIAFGHGDAAFVHNAIARFLRHDLRYNY
jgi:hypothetical protein